MACSPPKPARSIPWPDLWLRWLNRWRRAASEVEGAVFISENAAEDGKNGHQDPGDGRNEIGVEFSSADGPIFLIELLLLIRSVARTPDRRPSAAGFQFQQLPAGLNDGARQFTAHVLAAEAFHLEGKNGGCDDEINHF